MCIRDSYFIQPQKIGVFTIGPAEIEVEGRTLRSNTVTLDVKEALQPSNSDRDPVFLEASISPDRVYIEEQSIYTIKLYHRISVDDLSLNLPEIDQISFKQLGEPSNYQSVYKGVTYGVLEVRYVLSASKAGDYVIGPSRMNMTVREPGGRSLFDDLFKDPFSSFSSGRPLNLSTRPMKIEVQDLPEEGKPDNFSGLVGNFTIKSTVEPDRLKAGDSATMTIQVSGKGNVARIQDIDFPELPYAKTYNDQPVLKTEQDAHGIGGTKIMKWALVPKRPGRFDTPVLSLSFFNPDTEKYNILRTSRHVLTVLPGDTQETVAFNAFMKNGETIPGQVKKEIKQIGKDILPLHTFSGALSVPFRTLSAGLNFWIALFGPVTVYLVFLVGLKINQRSPESIAQLKAKNAFKNFKRQYQQVHSDGAALLDVFKDYLNDRFSQSIGTLTADDTARLLQKHNVNSHTISRICTIIGEIESTVYAESNSKISDKTDGLLSLIKELEKEIR